MSIGNKSLSGLGSIFVKLRRSNLQDFSLDAGAFQRGGLRATADPRLYWNDSQRINLRPIYGRNKPFDEWNVEAICNWFDEMGLGMYEEDLKKWLTNGGIDLMNASSLEMEKKINFESPLHRKKVELALNEITGKEIDGLSINSGQLDTSWVMRWLDDIGLPQHKDIFVYARIDGRMIHRLTFGDLAALQITSSLHAASIRRAIQVMRQNKWDPDCLIRRSFTYEMVNPNYSRSNSSNVHLWSAHRVMEWLREVNLAEFAPNLRGAGVHGALLVFEDRFTDALLADLLSIPSTKTLIRRHLFMQFKELLGSEIIQRKRQAETTLGYQPLTLTSKIKTPKKSQRKKTGDDFIDLVCPLRELDDELEVGNRRRGCFSGA